MSIRIQGNFDLPSVSGLEPDQQFEYRIACAQVLPSENGVKGKGGLDKLEEYAKEAAKREADVVVFPEYFLTGATHDSWHGVRDSIKDAPRSPIDPNDDPEHFLSLIGEIAKNNDIDIVAGTVVELGSHHVPHRNEESTDDDEIDEEHDKKLFNTVYYINRSGEIAGRYTKRVSRTEKDFCGNLAN
jgi:predicted amidohydrolase